jgi:hypothetical protein
MILSILSLTNACAAARKMECREWDKGVGGGLMGTYVFSLDDNGTLDVLSTPCKSNCSGALEGGKEKYGLLFPKIKQWTLIWSNDARAVFYGVADDHDAPVKVLRLDFGKPNMYDHHVGGVLGNREFQEQIC